MKKILVLLFALLFANAAAAQDGYRVGPGDTLSIEVLEDPGLNRSVLVLPNGSITFPFAGSLPVRGKTPGQIGSIIASGIAAQFAQTPNVFVSVQQLRPRIPSSSGPAPDPTVDIFFLGEWASPGPKELDEGVTMLQAMAAGGGFTNFAAQKRIQLRRTNTQTGAVSTVIINYQAIADGSEVLRDIVLQDGDVLVAPERRLFE
ncbi:polysaccharide biosynthesis/export family protein [Yoonia sp. R2331]|uniref:polysaccharide biosynthesis/export family protein n=1 Tax=Yoonia sp. R2331 TaxID=3237238 RepID=UPI0034E5E357